MHEAKLAPPYAESRPLRIETLELDPPGPGEVLVRMRAAGLCHSDLSVINGDRPRPVPMVLGHEACGDVLEVGAGVADLKAGDRVVLVFVASCGECLPCAEGRLPRQCELWSVARGQRARHAALGRAALAAGSDGDFASAGRVGFRGPRGGVAAVLFENRGRFRSGSSGVVRLRAVLTGVGAVVNTARVQPGTSVAVVGLGGVGMCAVLGALASGAREVIAVDLHDSKLLAAKAIGATAAVNARSPDAVERVKAWTRGGAETCFEMAGSVQAMDLAYRMTRRGGMTVTAGLPNPGHTWSMQHLSLVTEERTVKGSYLGSCVPMRDLPRFMALYQAGKLPVDKLMGERLALTEINRGFDHLASGEGLRNVIVF